MTTARLALSVSRFRIHGVISRIAGSSVLRDATTLGTGTLLSQVILFLAAPVFLRLYHPADFGLYSFTYGAITLAATVGTWNIERLIVIVPTRAKAIRLLAALVFVAAAAAALLLVLVALVRAADGVFSPQTRDRLALLWPAPLSMFILVVSTGLRFYLVRVRKFKAVAVARMSRAVVFAAGTVATGLSWKGLGGYGALVMLAWQSAGDACALFVQIGANPYVARLILLRPRLRRSLNVLTHHRRTLGILTVSQMINSVNHQIPISTVAFAFGAVYAGWYSLAVQFVFAPCAIVASAMMDVANQRFARLHAERRLSSRLVLRTTLGMAAIGAAPFALIIFLGPKLLPPILGPQWLGASQSVSALAVAAYLWFIVAPASTIALIVEARRYIIVWYVLKLVSLTALGAAALSGLISYELWLVMTVASDALLYLVEGIFSYAFACAAECSVKDQYLREWRQ